MSIFVKNKFHDFGLLPFPEFTKFDYYTLLKVARDLHRKPTLKHWEESALKHFHFNLPTSQLYYRIFLSLLDDNHPKTITHNYPHFLLFLFNQLHNSPSNASSFSDQDSFNNYFGLFDQDSIKTVPKELMYGRYLLSKYWKMNAIKWFHLISVAQDGGEEQTDEKKNGLFLDRSTIDILNFLFDAVIPVSDDKWSAKQRMFKDWIRTGSNEYTNNHHIDSKIVPVEVSITKLCENSIPLSLRGLRMYPIEILDSWISWTLVDNPYIFDRLRLSENGLAVGFKEPTIVSSLIPFLVHDPEHGRSINI